MNTLPEATIAAFEDDGTVACTIDQDVEEAEGVLEELAAVGVDMADVARRLETEGVATFTASFDALVETLEAKQEGLARR